MENDTQILQCNTAKHKLDESNFFLSLIKSKEIWNDDEKFPFYLNAFVLSSRSVTEYVRSNFMHLIKKPRINWKIYTDNNIERRNKKISEHPQSKLIINFLKEFDEKLEKLRKDPIVNYFFNKRNTIIHNRWDDSKSGTFIIHPDGTKEYPKRCLENRLPLQLSNSIQDYKIEFFNEYIAREKQLENLNRLCDKSLSDVCQEYLSKLNNFISLFDKREIIK